MRTYEAKRVAIASWHQTKPPKNIVVASARQHKLRLRGGGRVKQEKAVDGEGGFALYFLGLYVTRTQKSCGDCKVPKKCPKRDAACESNVCGSLSLPEPLCTEHLCGHVTLCYTTRQNNDLCTHTLSDKKRSKARRACGMVGHSTWFFCKWPCGDSPVIHFLPLLLAAYYLTKCIFWEALGVMPQTRLLHVLNEVVGASSHQSPQQQ